MDYFSYLSMTRKEDTKENFVAYLVDVVGYTEEKAIKESKIYYSEEN